MLFETLNLPEKTKMRIEFECVGTRGKCIDKKKNETFQECGIWWPLGIFIKGPSFPRYVTVAKGSSIKLTQSFTYKYRRLFCCIWL